MLWIIYKKQKLKISKSVRNNYLSIENFWKLKHCWYRFIYYRHPKTSHKLSKTMRQAEKVNSNISLYSDTKQRENLLNEKIQKY